MKVSVLVVFCYCFAFAKAQQTSLNGAQVVERSIAYHDPGDNWATFDGEFTIVLKTPDNADRRSVITLDLPNQYFNLSTQRGEETSFREVSQKRCRFTDEEEGVKIVSYDSPECERSKMMRDYYTYLYGLPMKLQDQGTHIEDRVAVKNYKGKEYLVVRVSYDAEVGSDIWQFYFDPKTYAMEVYQFFKSEDEQTGEYILLRDIVEVQGIKMPKDRAWYYNKDDGYLGTDTLLDK